MTNSKRETIYIGENFCQFREMEYNSAWKSTRENVSAMLKEETGYPSNHGLVCPLCNKDLVVGEMVYLVMNNNKLFPNTVIHKLCTNNDLHSTTLQLIQNYNSYKNLLEKYRAWI